MLGTGAPFAPRLHAAVRKAVFRQVSGNTLQQVETFKYLGVVCTSDGSRNKGIDTRIGEANVVVRELYCWVVTKRELLKTAKQNSSKDQIASLHLRPSLVPSRCGSQQKHLKFLLMVRYFGFF